MTRALRIAVVLDEGPIPRWQRTLFERLAEACEVTAFTAAGPARAPAGADPVARVLLGAYERWDRKRSRSGEDPLDLVEGPPSGGEPDPTAQDAFVWLARAALPSIPAELTHGVWYLCQGQAGAGHPAPLLAEVGQGSGIALTSLRAVTSKGDALLMTAAGSCDRMSMHRSRIRALAKAAELPTRHARDLIAGRERPAVKLPPAPAAPVPSATGVASIFCRIALRRLRGEVTSRLFEAQWVIAYRHSTTTSRPLSLPARFATIEPPRGRSYADPFPYDFSGQRGVMFEDFPSPAGRGAIASVRFDERGKPLAPETVLSREDHLSYPFLIARDAEQPTMVPESRQARRVELLRARDFPRGWETDRLLMERVPATDVTLLERDGRVWLFTAISADSGAAVDELHLFSAASLEGPWEPHPLNPVVSDVRWARPAGGLFEYNGRLYRPGQDCSRIYGWRIVLNRVELLDMEQYRETPVARIEPRGRLTTRAHTYNHRNGIEVLDAMRLVSRVVPVGLRARPLTFDLVLYEDAAPMPAGASPVTQR